MVVKQVFIDLAIVLSIPVILIGGNLTFGGSEDIAPIASPSTVIGAKDAGAKTKQALDILHGIKLDNALFKDEAYTSLTPFSAEIPEVPLLRSFPFTPPAIIEARLRQARLNNGAVKTVIATPVTTQNLSAKIDALKKSLK